MPDLFAYTDGACSGNPGPGGWGVVLRAMNGDTVMKERELCGGAPETTNNRMELMAAISALEALDRASAITVITDSAYVKDGITKWIHGWKRNNWQKKGGLKNADLWQRLDAAAARHRVTWEWVKGHAGHPENERADALARQGMAPLQTVTPRAVACPVLRWRGHVLVFRHPLAGLQLVKGGLRTTETPQAAACRELEEEAGIVTRPGRIMAVSTRIVPGQRWFLVDVRAGPLPRRWTHDCADDGGHRFRFHWHSLHRPLPRTDRRYRRAFALIRAHAFPEPKYPGA